MKHSFHRLDIMIAYSCNISCAGCISVSDQKRNGVASISDITTWVNEWSKVVDPEVITIFGGEPCLHPKLIEICRLVRQCWPTATIRLITNGYLLKNFDPSEWFNFGPFEIQVSVHRQDHVVQINQVIKTILDQKSNWKVKRYGGSDHRQLEWSHGDVKIYKSIFKDFIVPYKQEGTKLVAWNSNPVESHKICGSPSTPILYKGKLYKCPAVANVMDITDENWFNYHAVAVDEDLSEFISNINKPEPVCGQCPAQSQAIIIDHFNKNNVKTKNIN